MAVLHPPLMLLAPTDAVDSDAGPAAFLCRSSINGDGRQDPLLVSHRAGPFANGPHYTAQSPGAARAWGGAGGVEYSAPAGGGAWSPPPSLEPATPGPAPGVIQVGTSRSSAHDLGWVLPDSVAAPGIGAALGNGTGASARAQAAGVRALLLGFVDSDSDSASSEVVNEPLSRFKPSARATQHGAQRHGGA
jgi:hypothetical protein